MTVWQHLLANTQPQFATPVQPRVAFEQPSTQNASKTKKKRPAPSENISSVADRMIQPQQSFKFPPVNTSGDPATDQVATASVSGGPPKKKRGRPSKADYEAKLAEAAARGEEYQPPPKRKKTAQSSLQGAPTADMLTPSMAKVGPAGEGSTGKKKARKPKGTPEADSLAPESNARSLALEATTHAADQMQPDIWRPIRSTIPETQLSEVEPRGSLLAAMREHAGYTIPDTVQSTMTLQNDSTPLNDFALYHGPTRDSATTQK